MADGRTNENSNIKGKDTMQYLNWGKKRRNILNYKKAKKENGELEQSTYKEKETNIRKGENVNQTRSASHVD